jgi:hypothetical protein
VVPVSWTPTRATRQGQRSPSRGPMATTPLLQRGNGGSTPSGTIRSISSLIHDGPRVFRQHPFLVRRGTEFDSRADLGCFSIHMGCWSNGKTPGLQPGDRGSTPRWSTLGTNRRKWKVAGYGWPGRTANAVSPRGMRVRIPCLPLDQPRFLEMLRFR